MWQQRFDSVHIMFLKYVPCCCKDKYIHTYVRTYIFSILFVITVTLNCRWDLIMLIKGEMIPHLITQSRRSGPSPKNSKCSVKDLLSVKILTSNVCNTPDSLFTSVFVL